MKVMRPNKTFFFAKGHLFQKKRLFLQNNKKKRTINCTDLCKSI